MKIKKFFIIVIFIIFLVVAIYILFFKKQNGFQGTKQTGVNEIEIQKQIEVLSNVDSSGNRILLEKKEYQVSYFPDFDIFHIVILGKPFSEARIKAEQQFLRFIKLSPAEMCELNVVIATPFWANYEYSGEEYKLSFCE